MKRDLVDLLACPDCGGELALSADGGAGAEVDSGSLLCQGCEEAYPIRRGVPRFVEQSSSATADHFELEFTAEAEGDRDIDEPALLAFIFNSRTGLDPAATAPRADWYPTEAPEGYEPDWGSVEGRTVLEGGCGPGRFLPLLAPHARRVVGLELGPHVDRAADRCSGVDNVDLVQGSVLKPPFKRGAFDVTYSLGVLHHTPAPPDGASVLAALVGPGGTLAIWVYPPSYWGRGVQRLTGPAVNAYMKRIGPERAHRFARRRLMPLGRLQMRLARRRSTKVLAAPLFVVSVPRHPVPEVMLATIFDYFGAPIISTHKPDEVVEWLEGEGFVEVRELPVPTSVQAVRAAS